MRNWLKNKRKNKNLTQKKFALLVGISRSLYAMIENGDRTPSVPVAKKIAKELNFEWTIFFEDKCHKTCSEVNSALMNK